MITIIARWEDAQMPAEVEWRGWRRLKGAYKIDRLIFVGNALNMEAFDLEQYATMEEALAVAEGERVFLEPTGYNGMNDLPQGDIVLICGNADMHNMEHANVNETYSIKTEGKTTFFATEAAAIALAIRYGQ